MKSRALSVQRGWPPKTSVITLPQQVPGEGEVLVQVQAAALTPTDLLLCTGALAPPLDGLLPPPDAAAPFVPGTFFCGEVAAVGAFVEDLSVGEAVLGVINRGASAVSARSRRQGSTQLDDGEPAGAEGLAGGCYREWACVHFSYLLPVAPLASAFQMPSLLAHLPPMVDALFCVTTQLRLRANEALLVIAPRLVDVIFLLQRLLLIGDAWVGPLFLLLAQERVPGRAELERHPLLWPLLPGTRESSGRGELLSSGLGEPRHRPTFFENFVGISAAGLEEAPAQGQQAEALRDLVQQLVADHTGGVGLDAILALDVDLTPPPPKRLAQELPSAALLGDDADVGLMDGTARPPTLLRTLIGALSMRGRLITNCRRVEMMPADGEHLWIKEATLGFLNPHAAQLSAARYGSLLHGVVEVLGRVANSELPVVESEVVQFRLFEQFHHAVEASAGNSTRGIAEGLQLIALIV